MNTAGSKPLTLKSTPSPNSVSVFLRMASVLEEREEEIRSLHSDLQQKNSDIAGWSDTGISDFKTVLELLGFV